MNCIILCEGETDQILLSKYFGCQYGFQYEGNCHLNEHNVHIHGCEYKNGSDNFLQIAYVEGKNNFADALEYILWVNRLNAGKFFDYIAVVMDHDSDKEVLAVNRELQNVLAQACLDGEEMNFGWSSYRMKDVSFQDKRDIWDVRFILITLPIEENGALETFLLHSLAEKAENEYLVQQSEDNEYLAKRQRAQLAEALQLVDEYYAVYHKLPAKDVLAEFFWLFEKREKIMNKSFLSKMHCVGNFDESMQVFLCEKPRFDGYDEFIAYWRKQKMV